MNENGGRGGGGVKMFARKGGVGQNWWGEVEFV